MSLSKHEYSWDITLLPESVGRIVKTSPILSTHQVHKAGLLFLPQCSYCANMFVEHRSLWIPLFHLSGHPTPYFWVTETICIEKCWYNLSNLTNQRAGILEQVINILKKLLQALPPFLSPVSSHFIFFTLSIFRLSRRLEEATIHWIAWFVDVNFWH